MKWVQCLIKSAQIIVKGRAKNDCFPVLESSCVSCLNVRIHDKWVPMGPCERGDKHPDRVVVWVLFCVNKLHQGLEELPSKNR